MDKEYEYYARQVGGSMLQDVPKISCYRQRLRRRASVLLSLQFDALHVVHALTVIERCSRAGSLLMIYTVRRKPSTRKVDQQLCGLCFAGPRRDL